MLKTAISWIQTILASSMVACLCFEGGRERANEIILGWHSGSSSLHLLFLEWRLKRERRIFDLTPRHPQRLYP